MVNGGYTYDSELAALLPELLPGVTVETLDAGVIAAALDPVAPGRRAGRGGRCWPPPGPRSTRWTAT